MWNQGTINLWPIELRDSCFCSDIVGLLMNSLWKKGSNSGKLLDVWIWAVASLSFHLPFTAWGTHWPLKLDQHMIPYVSYHFSLSALSSSFRQQKNLRSIQYQERWSTFYCFPVFRYLFLLSVTFILDAGNVNIIFFCCSVLAYS